MDRTIGHSLTAALTTHSGTEIPTIQFTPLEIIYNKIHPSIKLHLKEKSTQLMTIHLVQEIKRDIIYRRTSKEETLPESAPTSCPPLKKTISLLAYQGTRNVQDSVNVLTLLETAVTDRI